MCLVAVAGREAANNRRRDARFTGSSEVRGLGWASIHVARGLVCDCPPVSGRARAAKLALLDGFAGAVWAPGGQPRVVFGFTIHGGKIVEIELLADPEQLERLDLAIIDA